MVQLLVEHDGLLDDGEVETLAFLGLEIMQALLLQHIVSILCLLLGLFLLSLPMVSDLHELLCTLPLPLDSIQKLLLVPLQDAEPCL